MMTFFHRFYFKKWSFCSHFTRTHSIDSALNPRSGLRTIINSVRSPLEPLLLLLGIFKNTMQNRLLKSKRCLCSIILVTVFSLLVLKNIIIISDIYDWDINTSLDLKVYIKPHESTTLVYPKIKLNRYVQ